LTGFSFGIIGVPVTPWASSRTTNLAFDPTPILETAKVGILTEFAQKLADEIRPGTTVIVTDQQVVRNPVPDSTYFAAN